MTHPHKIRKWPFAVCWRFHAGCDPLRTFNISHQNEQQRKQEFEDNQLIFRGRRTLNVNAEGELVASHWCGRPVDTSQPVDTGQQSAVSSTNYEELKVIVSDRKRPSCGIQPSR